MINVLIDKTHLSWGLACAAALGVATAGYAWSTAGGRDPAGGSPAGLTFGVLALAAMSFAGLLAVRKKFPGLRLGSAQFWLRGHIWLGLLSVPLTFFHSGFRFGGALEWTLMALFLIVIASGVYGLALQQALPRFLKVRVPLETFPQQIPALCQAFQDEADQLIKKLEAAAKKGGPSSMIAKSAVLAAAAKAPVAAASDPAAPVKAAATSSTADKLAAIKAAAAAKKAGAGASTPTSPKATAASSTADKLAAIKAAAAAKKAAAETPPAAPPTEATAGAETTNPSSATLAPAGEEKPAPKMSPDKAELLAKLAAKKAAAHAAAGDGAPAAPAADPAAAAPTGAPTPSPDKAALLAKLAAKKAAPSGAAPVSAGPPSSGPMSMSSATRSEGRPRLQRLTRFYEKEVRPFLSGDERVAARQQVASENYARMAFATLAKELPTQALEVIEQLEAMVVERRQFLVQVRIQRWLRNWLLVHVPLSAALFVLAAWHVFAALRVVPWL